MNVIGLFSVKNKDYNKVIKFVYHILSYFKKKILTMKG